MVGAHTRGASCATDGTGRCCCAGETGAGARGEAAGGTGSTAPSLGRAGSTEGAVAERRDGDWRGGGAGWDSTEGDRGRGGAGDGDTMGSMALGGGGGGGGRAGGATCDDGTDGNFATAPTSEGEGSTAKRVAKNRSISAVAGVSRASAPKTAARALPPAGVAVAVGCCIGDDGDAAVAVEDAGAARSRCSLCAIGGTSPCEASGVAGMRALMDGDSGTMGGGRAGSGDGGGGVDAGEAAGTAGAADGSGAESDGGSTATRPERQEMSEPMSRGSEYASMYE